MNRYLAIYLRNHEAAACGGLDHFRRMEHTQRDRPWAQDLVELRHDIDQDLQTLRRLMTEFDIRRDLLAGAVIRVAEKAGRAKPNGHLRSRSPLSDLIEIQGTQDAVHAKSAGWRTLLSAGLKPATADLDELLRRAERQRDQLLDLHANAARSALATKP